MFWFRPRALKALFEKNWEYEDFPKEPNKNDGTLLHAVERVYPFVAQSEGYYPAWLMSDAFARIEVTNLSYMLRELNKVAFAIYGKNSHYDLISIMTYELNKPGDRLDRIFRKLLKEKIKRHIPKSIWAGLKKFYHLLGGKKWVG